MPDYYKYSVSQKSQIVNLELPIFDDLICKTTKQTLLHLNYYENNKSLLSASLAGNITGIQCLQLVHKDFQNMLQNYEDKPSKITGAKVIDP